MGFEQMNDVENPVDQEESQENQSEKEKIADLKTYLKEHKEIELPSAEIGEQLKEEMLENVGSFSVHFDPKKENPFSLRYIGKDEEGANLSGVEIDINKIKEFEDEIDKINKELEGGADPDFLREVYGERSKGQYREMEENFGTARVALLEKKLKSLNFKSWPEGASGFQRVRNLWERIIDTKQKYDRSRKKEENFEF